VSATIDNGTDVVTDPIDAEMVTEPSDAPVAWPVVGTTVATAGVSEAHVAVFVTFAVEPSEYVPMAVSCTEMPTPENAGLGLIEIASSVDDGAPELLELELLLEELPLLPLPPHAVRNATSASAPSIPDVLLIASIGTPLTRLA
jgi:hypothetical protein